jgi:nucleoside-diphosphate-sugar epimerase
MKRVLLTGVTGMIGRHCVPVLIQRGFEVHAILHRMRLEKITGLHQYQIDLLEPGAVSAVARSIAPTHLLHLAWSPMPRGWAAETEAEARPWVDASMTLARQFTLAGGQRVVMAGTCAEYDWSGGLCSEDKTPIRPVSAYGICKDALHREMKSFCREMGIDHAWARIFFVYGPHENPRRLVPSVIRSLLHDEIARCSHGNQIRDYLYVEDVAEALITLLESGAYGSFNIGSGQPVRLRDMVMQIAETVGRPDLVRFGELVTNDAEAPLVVADTHRLKSIIGWEPRYLMEQGLRKTISWWRLLLEATPLPQRQA